MKNYEDLTPEEKQEICNGCGGKGGWVKPPHKVFFEASCNHHDFGYWKGCTEADRLDCDNKFYAAMIKDCSAVSYLDYLRYRPWCWIYYMAVRTFGKQHFYYADKQRELF